MNATRARLALAALALLALGAACSSSNGGDSAGRLSVDGRAEVAAPGEEAEVETGSRTVRFGERVKILEGTATVRLQRGRELELRTGTNVVLERVEVDDDAETQPRLLESDLLVHAPDDARLTVSTEGAEVIVRGDAQVSRGAVVVVSSYAGDVELRSGEVSTIIPGLRSLTVPSDGTPAGAPVPLVYNAGDSWNRRFLTEAIQLGNELEARSKGFTAQLGAADGRTQEFLVGLLPPLAGQPGLSGLFDPARSPGETLVGAAIVLESSRGTFAERWVAVFGFRDQGAQWGLVAYDQGVKRAPLLAAVDGAIGRGPSAFEPIPLPGEPGSPDGGLAAPGTGGPGGTPGSGPGGGTTVTAAPGSPTPSASVPTTVPPPTPPNPNIGPLNTGIPLLDNTINSLVETLSGLLRSLAAG